MLFFYNIIGDYVKVYLDLIMIINFFIDFLLLLGVSIILKRKVKINRIILSAFIGGISILFLFMNLNSIELFLFKFLLSIIMIIIAFGFRNIKYTIVNIIYLYIISVFLGGGLYLLNIQFSYKQTGIVFFHNGFSINIIFILIFTPIIIFIYLKQNKKINSNYSNYYNVRIYLKEKYIDLIGYLDTGNNLIDPITKKPVILIDKKKYTFEIKEFMLVPLHTVSGNDFIKCIKMDKIIINNKEYNKVLLGIIENIDLDGIDLILNNKLEGIC